MPASIEFEDVLRECATEKAYRDACKEATDGSDFNPDALEPLWRELRTNRGRYLLRSDLDRIFEEGKTVYAYYWRWSKLNAWEDTAISLHESQCANSGWKESIVQKLRAHLRRMEIVSVLLSCVYPEDFAVYSPPIMTILHVPPCTPMQHYLRYCEELREWGRHFLGAESVRKADRALWVFYQRAYASDVKTRLTYRKAYDEDYWIRQRHAKTMLESYFSGQPALKQARFLLDIDLYLAATIAGCEFEVRLRNLVPPARKRRLPHEDLWSVIEYLAANCGYAHKKNLFHEIRELRNMAIHRVRGLTVEKAGMMIRETNLIPQRVRGAGASGSRPGFGR
jgi:hypothetical protein